MADAIEKTPIPDTPPTEAKATQGSMRGIAALKKACIEGGLTSKYAQCAMLGIVGVESVWIPVQEGMNYSKKTLLSGLFSNVSEADAEKWYNAGKRGIPRIEFFGWLYGTRLPAGTPAAGNYYGRGFIQLTGLDNYKKAKEKTGLDLVNNPDIMVGSDDATMEICAKIAVEFFKWRIPNWNTEQHLPSFIFKALRAVNPGDKKGSDHYNKKVRYYEYFLGGKAADAPTNKDPTNTTVNKTRAEIDAAPVNKKEAYSEDRSANFSTEGFTDPEGKYPLRDYMNEPDTNRLARGIIDGTNIKYKDATRKTDIPLANTTGTYDQPLSAYNTIYPFNKVFESEGGHVLEFDDSPEGERINLYHRKGTFIEIDPNGSQVNYIVGDGYYITENNGNIFINGTCNVTCSGPMNILCQGNANLEVKGQVDAVFHNVVNMGVAKDFNLAIGGDYNILVEGNYNLEVGKTSNTRAIGTMSIESTDALKLKTAKTISMEGGDTASTAETLMKMSSSFKLETPADFQIKAKTFTLDIETDTKIKTNTFLLETEETSEIKTGTFKTETLTGDLELKSFSNINMTANVDLAASALIKVDLNPVVPVVISAISNKVESLALLGSPKVPVDFAGNPVKDRQEEPVLVDTVLNPAGEYNPNTLSKNIIDSVLDSIPLVGDILSSFGGVTPNVYDKKYADTPVESKTSLAAANSATTNRLVVPPIESAYNEGHANLVPPERHSDASYKYETEEDWNTPSGQKAANAMTTTSDYEYNHKLPGDPQEASAMTGGSSSVVAISDEKREDIKNRTDFPANYPLSEHFTLGMFVHSQGTVLRDTTLTAGQSGSRGGHYTKQDIVANLAALCENVMEPIYKELGPCLQMGGGATWKINSGLRNEKTGSDHNKGMACDFRLYPGRDTNELYDLVVKLEKILPYHQIIFEYRDNGRSNWIHVSFSSEGRQARAFTMIDDKVVDSSGNAKAGSTGLYKFYT